MTTKRITLTRRIVQTACFAFLLYGVFLYDKPVRTPFLEIESGTPRTAIYPRDRALWVSGESTVLEFYPPMLVCRFVAKGGIFKACSLHMFSENLTWQSSLPEVLSSVVLKRVIAAPEDGFLYHQLGAFLFYRVYRVNSCRSFTVDGKWREALSVSNALRVKI